MWVGVIYLNISGVIYKVARSRDSKFHFSELQTLNVRENSKMWPRKNDLWEIQADIAA